MKNIFFEMIFQRICVILKEIKKYLEIFFQNTPFFIPLGRNLWTEADQKSGFRSKQSEHFMEKGA